MPFVRPVSTTRNSARYKVIDSTEDFHLQEHRYSLRKKRHFYWVRIITRHTPTYKVAQCVDAARARKREWKFIKEGLAAYLTPEIEQLPPGHEDRREFLLKLIGRIRKQLPEVDNDVVEDYSDDEDEYADADEYYDHEGPEEEEEEEEVEDGEFWNDETNGSWDGNTNKSQDGRAKSQQPTRTLGLKQRSKSERSEKHQNSPDVAARKGTENGRTNRFNLRRMMTSRRTDESDQSVEYNSEPEMDTRAVSRLSSPTQNLRHRRQLSDPMDPSKSSLVAQSAPRPLTPSAAANSTSSSSSFLPRALRSNLSLILGPQQMGKPDEDLQLPNYLTDTANMDLDATGATTKEKLTMEKLKTAHERKSMAKACGGLTFACVLMRIVSFDAWVVLLVLLNIGACYGVQNRHSFAKTFVKGSVKRRIKFSQQVFKARFGRNKSASTDADKVKDVPSAADSSNQLVSAPSSRRLGLFRSVSNPPAEGKSPSTD